VEQKLVLFYLVNDIVQHSAKKGFTELLDKFKSGIKESMPHLKEEKIAYKVPVPTVVVAKLVMMQIFTKGTNICIAQLLPVWRIRIQLDPYLYYWLSWIRIRILSKYWIRICV